MDPLSWYSRMQGGCRYLALHQCVVLMVLSTDNTQVTLLLYVPVTCFRGLKCQRLPGWVSWVNCIRRYSRLQWVAATADSAFWIYICERPVTFGSSSSFPLNDSTILPFWISSCHLSPWLLKTWRRPRNIEVLLPFEFWCWHGQVNSTFLPKHAHWVLQSLYTTQPNIPSKGIQLFCNFLYLQILICPWI